MGLCGLVWRVRLWVVIIWPVVVGVGCSGRPAGRVAELGTLDGKAVSLVVRYRMGVYSTDGKPVSSFEVLKANGLDPQVRRLHVVEQGEPQWEGGDIMELVIRNEKLQVSSGGDIIACYADAVLSVRKIP